MLAKGRVRVALHMEPRHRLRPIILARAREMRHPQTPAEATLWRALRNEVQDLSLDDSIQ